MRGVASLHVEMGRCLLWLMWWRGWAGAMERGFERWLARVHESR